MGEVFLARTPGDTALDGLVAVKTVRRDLARSDEFRARFRREISLARSVEGPHLARLTGGEADGTPPWLATEYIAGPTLTQAVRRSGPGPAEPETAAGARTAGCGVVTVPWCRPPALPRVRETSASRPPPWTHGPRAGHRGVPGSPAGRATAPCAPRC
ncbi:hypothetical protein [Streptomyces iconiensis]|uniref:Protein kinase domain-containing protein n=1 Tax=Streptomyces iconiensis TaxID=1384038 RepID=A0ABT6ZNI0_9ACTN|nr:hypothetical protein [Streptomyces iconiensis]MDJ1130612.1 hypothetical protein [Streptomyces iconiensis]